jgi:hypothetical protein
VGKARHQVNNAIETQERRARGRANLMKRFLRARTKAGRVSRRKAVLGMMMKMIAHPLYDESESRTKAPTNIRSQAKVLRPITIKVMMRSMNSRNSISFEEGY